MNIRSLLSNLKNFFNKVHLLIDNEPMLKLKNKFYFKIIVVINIVYNHLFFFF